MTDEERGKQIIESVYKASLQALFSIGVKSPQYVEAFTAALMTSLDREFLKIGLFHPHEEAQETPVGSGQPSSPIKSINDIVDTLGISPLICYNLNKVGIVTIEQLMSAMQKQSLTDIKGIKEKSAKQILERLKIWNSI